MQRLLWFGFVAFGIVGLFGHAGCRVGPDEYGDAAPGTTSPSSGGSAATASSGSAAQSGTDDDPAEPSRATGGSAGNSATPSHDASTAGEPGDAPTATSAGGASSATSSGGTAGEGEGSGDADPEPTPGSPTCSAQPVTFDEIRAGSVRPNVKVQVSATATSQKFLLSHTRSGGCLFAAFIGIAPDTKGPRGLLVVSYGDDAPEDDACPTGTDAIPDDLAVGDALAAVGYLSAYAPSGCSAVPSPQLMVDATCPFERTGRTAAPEPFTLSLDQADAIARGSDQSTLRIFAGGLVQLENVTARRPEDGSGSVGPYGVIQLNETRLELHNDLEYGDLTLGGPGDGEKSLDFPYPQSFASVTGLVYLDYCTWSLTPRSRCADFSPPSRNCR
jgi:hypothetical protein